MLKIKRNRILHLLPEKDIMETLKDFVITEDNHMNNTSVGLVVLDEKDITITNTHNAILNQNIKRDFDAVTLLPISIK